MRISIIPTFCLLTNCTLIGEVIWITLPGPNLSHEIVQLADVGCYCCLPVLHGVQPPTHLPAYSPCRMNSWHYLSKQSILRWHSMRRTRTTAVPTNVPQGARAYIMGASPCWEVWEPLGKTPRKSCKTVAYSGKPWATPETCENLTGQQDDHGELRETMINHRFLWAILRNYGRSVAP